MHSKHFLNNNTLFYVPVYPGKFVQNLFLLHCSTMCLQVQVTGLMDWLRSEWPVDCVTDWLTGAEQLCLNLTSMTTGRSVLVRWIISPLNETSFTMKSEYLSHTNQTKHVTASSDCVSHYENRGRGLRWCLLNTQTKQSMSLHCRFWVCPILLIIIIYFI